MRKPVFQACDQVTVKPVQNDHSKNDKAKILITNGNLMKVKSIAECSPSAIFLTCIKRNFCLESLFLAFF